MCSDCTESGDHFPDDDEFLNGANKAKDTTALARPSALADQEFDEHGRGYWVCPGMDAQIPGGSNSADRHLHETRSPALKANANLVSSLCKDGKHRPVLDFDFPVRYVVSTTPGHGHLYIDKPLRWAQYKRLLKVMVEIGLLEPGYVSASLAREATFVRPPWVKKPAVEPEE
jgi:hypothetical protein